MKKISLIIMTITFLFTFAGTGLPATSSLDNLQGGAGIAYWQAGGGWTSLINIQEVAHECAQVSVTIYNRNATALLNFTLSLLANDNVGLVVTGDGTNIQLYDYSDTAYGGIPTLQDVSSGIPLVLAVAADTDGIQRGYMTFVMSNTGCSGPGGTPTGNISLSYAVVPDNLMIRSALLTPNSAFAINAAMLQGFANISSPISEADFINTTTTPNSLNPCDVNNDGDTLDSFVSVEAGRGVDIDFLELFLTDNVTDSFPQIICNPGTELWKALGSHNGWYCGRFNANPSVGTATTLVVVIPQSTATSAALFPRNLTVFSFDDSANVYLWGPSTVSPVSALKFGTGGISIGPATAGEACFYLPVPVFGFTFTESASFADVYPLMKSNVSISTLNKDNIDDDVDVIYIP